MSDYYLVTKGDDIYHHGILGQRWGVRRYQNADGSLTLQGKARYGRTKEERQAARSEIRKQKNISVGKERLNKRIERANNMEEVDRLSVKAGWKNTVKAGEGQKRIASIKDISMEILKSESRTEALGQGTRTRKHATIAGMSVSGILAAGGAATIAVMESPLVFMSLPVAGAATATIAGYQYLKKLKY